MEWHGRGNAAITCLQLNGQLCQVAFSPCAAQQSAHFDQRDELSRSIQECRRLEVLCRCVVLSLCQLAVIAYHLSTRRQSITARDTQAIIVSGRSSLNRTPGSDSITRKFQPRFLLTIGIGTRGSQTVTRLRPNLYTQKKYAALWCDMWAFLGWCTSCHKKCEVLFVAILYVK